MQTCLHAAQVLTACTCTFKSCQAYAEPHFLRSLSFCTVTLHKIVASELINQQHRHLCCSAPLSAGQLTLSAAQKHEERILKEALKKRRDEVGPPPGLSTASQIPATQSFSFRLPPRPQAAAQLQDSSAAQQAMPSTPLDQPEMQAGNSNQQAFPGASQDPAETKSPTRIKWQTQSAAKDDTLPNSQQDQGHGAPAGFVAFGTSNK